jgi:hypothetical protein
MNKLTCNHKAEDARQRHLQQLVKRLEKRIQHLEDENANLQYWAELHNNWAIGHNSERMADFARHRKELHGLLKLKPFDKARDRYTRFIKRQTKKMHAVWHKRKPLKP